METLQLLIVLLIVAAAAAYAGRNFLRQFSTGSDEAEGCATCSANETAQSLETTDALEAGILSATDPPLVKLRSAGTDAP